jgi:hypothetical protein
MTTTEARTAIRTYSSTLTQAYNGHVPADGTEVLYARSNAEGALRRAPYDAETYALWHAAHGKHVRLAMAGWPA